MPDGDPNSKIAIIGARPAYDEVRSGKAYTGPTGQKLWRWLGIPRSECYVSNVRRDWADHDVSERELTEALPILREELSHIKPNILITLGPAALTAVTGKRGITNWRGSILESTIIPGLKVLPTLQPASADTTFSLRYVIELDLRKARRESQYPDIRRPQRTFHINPPFEEACSILRSLGATISVDIETLGNTISCIGIADSPSRGICIAFVGGPYTTDELIALWRELDVVLRTRACRGQNFQFDTTRLERYGFKINNIADDTMLKHHLLWTELGSGVKRKQGDRGIDSLTGKHSLAFISSIYTDEPYYKYEADSCWNDPGLELGERFHRYWTYNLKDCFVTEESGLAMDKELIRFNQVEYFREHVLGLIRPVMRMQDRGLFVDHTALSTTSKRTKLEQDVLQQQLDQAVGFHCNVKSPADIRYVIQEVLHEKLSKLTKKGAISTDEDTIRTLAYRGEHTEIYRLILDIRERRTLLSNFLSLETDGGRYKASYLIHGTDSGRLSSRAVGKGPQLQNIPKPTRKIFKPEPGNVYVQGDLARAEAMYVAYDAQELELIKLFEDPTRDLYLETAARALGRSVGKESIERMVFKQVVLGSNYLMGPMKLVSVLGLKGIDIMKLPVPGNSRKAKAVYVQDGYFNLYPRLRRWQAEIGREIRENRCLVDPFGRRHMFLGRLDDSSLGIALSRKPQSTIVGITNRAIRLLDQQGRYICAQVHDSILTECKRAQRDEEANAIREAMTCPLSVHGRTMTIPVDLQWSDQSWGDMVTWQP
jgi:uracil-DNA glycosylase family 4